MAGNEKAGVPMCDPNILKKERVCLVENVIFENVMPCIKKYLNYNQKDTIDGERTKGDKIRKVLEFIERLTAASQFEAFNALMMAIGGTQPDLFERLLDRVPSDSERTFSVTNIAQEMKAIIIETDHCTDSKLDEKISLDNQHVELSIVDRQSSNSEPEHSIPHEYGDHLTRLQGSDRNIPAYDILSSKSKPNEKVLVFGKAGVGKSTTTQWLARQWAQGKWATGVTLLFLLQARFLTNVEAPITALQLLILYGLYQLGEMAESTLLSSWLKNSASRILIFVDGLDEIPEFAKRMMNTRRISDLTQKAHPIDLIINILRGDLLPHSKVISASRPFLGLSNLCVDSKAEVLGLTSTKVMEYVKCKYPENANHIMSILGRNPILLSVCGITYYCMLISRLLSEGVVLIDEDVQTYTRLMAFILVQYTSRKVSDSSFCLETNKYLTKFAHMAFSGIFQSKDNKLSKLFFDEKDLIEFKIDADVLSCVRKTGIIQATERRIGHQSSVIAEFFHLSGQEMLAVLHFLSNAECPDSTLNILFAGGHFDMALMYSFGLNFDKSSWINKLWTAMGSSDPGADTSISSKLSLFIDQLLKGSKNKLKVCQLIYEAQWVDKAKEVFSHIAPNGELSMKEVTMTAIDLLAVDFVCRCARSLSSIRLHRVNADATFVKVMMFSLVKHNLSTLQVLRLSDNSIGAEGLKTIIESLSHTVRDSAGPETGAGTTADMVQTNMLKTNNSLHTLNISRNSIGAAGVEAIAAMLETNTGLHTLDISDNSICAAGAEAIAAMLKTNNSLHRLNISRNSICAAGAEAIAAMLKTNTSLHSLNISMDYILDAGAEAIAAMLETNTSLHTLNISRNSIGAAGAEAIAAMLETNTSLHTLNISGNSIDDAGAEAIVAKLETNTSLHTLNISDNSIDDAGAEAIAAMLETNTSLHTLNISCNRIFAAGAEAIAAMLVTNTSLHTLDITWNRIVDVGAEALAAGLYKNTNLTMLNIGGNSIGSAGEKALTDASQHRPSLEINLQLYRVGPTVKP